MNLSKTHKAAAMVADVEGTSTHQLP